MQDDKARLSARVVPGDKVRLVSPASCPEPEGIEESVRVLEGWGLIAEVAEHALARWGYMAGRDSERLEDLFCGHDLVGADDGPDQSAVPVGTMAVLDAGRGSLTLEPCAR